jgi:hypothetical protein
MQLRDSAAQTLERLQVPAGIPDSKCVNGTWKVKQLNDLALRWRALQQGTRPSPNGRTQSPRRPQYANASYAFCGKDEKRLGVTA